MNIRHIISFLACIAALPSLAGMYDHFGWYDKIVLFPHQIAISDLICTGTVVSNSNKSAQLSIDEILWGTASSTNIPIRCVDELDNMSLVANKRYLVFAFTNNWWSSNNDNRRDTCLLVNFHSSTNRPSNKAVFSDYRIIDPNNSAISFDRFDYNGTNYWDATRAFVTNFLDITRIQCDEVKAFRKIDSIINDPAQCTNYPQWLRRQFIKYEFARYRNKEPHTSNGNNQ